MRVFLLFVGTLIVFASGFMLSSHLYRRVSNRAQSSQSLRMSTMTTVGVCIEPGAESFFKEKPELTPVPWRDALEHISEKLGWDGDDIELQILHPEDLESVNANSHRPEILMLIDLKESSFEAVKKQGADVLKNCKAVKTFDCPQCFTQLEKFGLYERESSMEGLLKVADKFLSKKGPRAVQRNAYEITEDVWARKSADDMVFLINVMVDVFVKPIKSVKAVTSTDETSLQQLGQMVNCCGKEMVDCFSNPTCRAALACLDNCKGNDQVCQYRCITSFETADFEKFAQCIIQKYNIMGNSASIPTTPDPQPLGSFREQKLTAEIADEIFIGHLKDPPSEEEIQERIRIQLFENASSADSPWSWKVVCGQNPAYDYFNCQHQIFYKDKKGAMWYDPVFKVEKFDGKEVWRRRHYRVRRGKLPGQFYFSVLDNGVVSNEFWRILDCADDLSWAVFYYCGAASAAGTNYRGALIVTKDGNWPDTSLPGVRDRISAALDRGGIKMWEMYEVNNENCEGDLCMAGEPPLSIKGYK